MGVGASADVNWTYPPPPGRDFWGYQPNSLKKPPQKVWSELFNTGLPPYQPAIIPHSYSSNLSRVSPVFGIGGQGRDILQSFGAAINTLQDGGVISTSGTPQIDISPAPMFPEANDRSWPPPGGDANVCTPLNYPNCNMQQWHDLNDKQPKQYQAWWSNFVQVSPANTVGGGALPISSTTVDLPGKWQTLTNKLTEGYLAGDYDALYLVNSKNTATIDPCDGPGFFGTLLPFLTGALLTAVPNVTIKTLMEAVGTDAQIAMDIGAAVTGYCVGKVAYLGDDPRAETFKSKGAGAVTIGGGYFAGAVLGNQFFPNLVAPQTYALRLGVSFLAYRLLFDAVRVSVIPANFLFVITSAILRTLDFIGKFFCYMTNWGYNVCNDFDTLPDARKWDVASIAAILADRAADKEGWGREDPRREFVFRGLITGPAMLNAAADDIQGGIYNTQRVNPLGSWLQVHTSLLPWEYSLFAKNYNYTVGNKFTGEYSSITGEAEQQGWWGNHEDHNRYACNNIDVILNALEDKADEKDQTPDTPESSVQKERDVLLAGRLNADYAPVGSADAVKNWVRELVAKARDPNNIRLQGQIPGMNGSQAPKFDYDVSVYLRTCANDFKSEGGADYGTGFNNVQERGQYAFTYSKERAQTLANVGNDEQALLEANGCFKSFPTEAAALDYYQERHVTQTNLAMTVQYWHKPKGEAQRWSFDRTWSSPNDPRVQFLLAQQVSQFEFPFVNPTKTLPLGPSMHHLLPAQHTHALPLPGHLDPLPGPPTLPSQRLLQYLEMQLQGAGWAGVKNQFNSAGKTYPTQYSKDAYFDATQIYYGVAMKSLTPDQAMDAVLNGLTDSEMCEAAAVLMGDARHLWATITREGQQFLRGLVSQRCSNELGSTTPGQTHSVGLNPAHHTHSVRLDPAQHTHSVPLPPHLQPLPQPPLHMKLPTMHPIQLLPSQELCQALDLLLKIQGWEAVAARFHALGPDFPNNFSRDGYFYVCLAFQYVSLNGMSPDNAYVKVYNDENAVNARMACDFIHKMINHAPTYFSQCSSAGQENAEMLEKICGR